MSCLFCLSLKVSVSLAICGHLKEELYTYRLDALDLFDPPGRKEPYRRNAELHVNSLDCELRTAGSLCLSRVSFAPVSIE